MLSVFPDPLRSQVEIIEESQPLGWQEIEIAEYLPWSAKRLAIRLNGLARLFYFSKNILGHTRLSPNLHGYMAGILENETLRLVLEIPRGHFKTTIATISGSIWWGLPFLEEDEQAMRELGYGDAFIRWMKIAHDTHTRTLLCSEVGRNIKDLGDQIDGHYQRNDTFRFIYPEIIPKSFSRHWNESSKTQVRIGIADGFHGEGTFDLIGAGSAMQSRHYKRIIEDDLVGEEAIKSEMVMQGTIEWHTRLPGLFDTVPDDPDRLGDQLVIGNRWSKKDLNQYIRDNDTLRKWSFITHSAEGGCPPPCNMHPAHTPIFPEEFSMKKLAQIKVEEKAYGYSCHYLNNPVAKDAVRFDERWLRHYKVDIWQEEKVTPENTANWAQLSHSNKFLTVDQLDNQEGVEPRRLKKALHHETMAGETIDDIRAGDIDRVAILDPNHAGEHGRSRNTIVVLGVYNRPREMRRIYLLESWSKVCGHDEWIEAAVGTRPGKRGLCLSWKVHHLYIEGDAAGQQGWKYLFKEKVRNMLGSEHVFSVKDLKTDRSENGMHKRILGMEAIYSEGFFWTPRHGNGVDLFLEEYNEYPNGRFTDILSTIGYSPQTWSLGSRAGARDVVSEEMKKRKAMVSGMGPAGY